MKIIHNPGRIARAIANGLPLHHDRSLRAPLAALLDYATRCGMTDLQYFYSGCSFVARVYGMLTWVFVSRWSCGLVLVVHEHTGGDIFTMNLGPVVIIVSRDDDGRMSIRWGR